MKVAFEGQCVGGGTDRRTEADRQTDRREGANMSRTLRGSREPLLVVVAVRSVARSDCIVASAQTRA